MKKKLVVFLGILLSSFMVLHAQQHSCLTDEVQKEQEAKDPSLARDREAAEKMFRSLDVRKFLNSKGATIDANGKYTGTIYTIPVVVHVIVPNHEAPGTLYNPSDAQVQAWVDRVNRIYAVTEQGNFFPEGPGDNGGTVMPFKLALAKRTKDCTPTTGVIRYDGSVLQNYAQHGVNQNGFTAGVAQDQIPLLAPHWPETSYYNIYIINGFNDMTNVGGFAGYPQSSNTGYHSYMGSALITSTNETIFAHEFGHSTGLDHPFLGGADANSCPLAPANDCTKDNDGVCDTAPHKQLLSPLPSDTDINPCTNDVYHGVQYNIMGYSATKKFTPGQRDKALALFLLSRETLTTSLGATDLTTSPGAVGTLLPTTCVIPNPNTDLAGARGPQLVKLGNINNRTEGRYKTNNAYYIDYSLEICINAVIRTNLTVGQSYPLQIAIRGNPQYVQAWIDYNNNGAFETSEMVTSSVTKVPTPNGFGTDAIWSATVTPPVGAVLNTPLRFRVRAGNETGACTAPLSGQVEDYMVTLKPQTTLNTNEEDTKDAKFVITYSKDENKLVSNSVIGDYTIYDMSGKLVQKGNTKTREIKLTFTQSGVYVIANEIYKTKFSK